MLIDWKPVDSSNIEAVAYDEPTNTLHVRFKAKKGGHPSVYSYHNVPKATYHALRDHDSPGSFFHHNLKGKFNSVKHP